MKILRILSTALLLVLVLVVSDVHGQETHQSQGKAFVDSLLQRMTLKEKLGQLVTIHGGSTNYEEYVKKGWIGNANGLHPGIDAMAKNRQVQDWAMQSRLQIPVSFSADVIHGYRTIFPVPLAMSCAWDPGLVEELDRMATREATTEGVNWNFSPMVDVSRDARWGRVVESAGEDPWLNSVIARAEVRGFQGDDLSDSTTMAATAKHFVGYGAAEAGRDYNTVDMSERRLREIYLPPFRAAVDAGVQSVMAGFHAYNRIPTSANHWLLTNVLRDEMGFDGVLVSDYDAILQLENHGVAADDKEAVQLGFDAGIDVDLHSGIYFEQLPKLLEEGRVDMDEINRRVRHVLIMKYRLGMFDDAYRYFSKQRAQKELITTENRRLVRKAARESMVLLKNEGEVLPLHGGLKNIALVGPLGDAREDLLGPVHAVGRSDETVSILDGLKRVASPGTQISYSKGTGILEAGSDEKMQEALDRASRADVIVAAVGEAGNMSGEAASRSQIRIPEPQMELLKKLDATGKPLVVVLINGRPLALPWVDEHADAILEAWLPGTEGGNAVAELLFGKDNPSGKLTTSFPRNEGQLPLYYNALPTGRPATDDKWTSKYLDVPNTALYPFGFGLSYTTFEYSDIRLNKSTISTDESVRASIMVTNTGDRDGEEIVQLYLRDPVASVSRPVKELRGFKKIHLQAGQSRRVTFEINRDDLSFIGPNMKPIVEDGTFKVMIGPNSSDLNKVSFRLTD